VKKLKRTNFNLMAVDIFLYDVVISLGYSQFSVSQMISEKHDTYNNSILARIVD